MNDYKELEKKIGITFEDYNILRTAFVHKSYINEHKNSEKSDNERLEFLGDAVLELASTKHLFEKCPKSPEGELTTFRSALVKGKHLAEIAKELDLGKYLLLSRGEEKSGGRDKNYILANTLESLIGAIYLDQGDDAAEKFVEKFILTKFDGIIKKGLHVDAKTCFQENCQEKVGITPHYEVIKEEGPDHNKKYTTGAYVNDELIATGIGSSKQKAEDEAAKSAIKIKGWN